MSGVDDFEAEEWSCKPNEELCGNVEEQTNGECKGGRRKGCRRRPARVGFVSRKMFYGRTAIISFAAWN
jgi:hypothetical protein